MVTFLPEETELAIRTSAGRMLLVGTAQIAAKTTRDSQGVAVVTLKNEPDHRLRRPGGYAGTGQPPTATASAACRRPVRSSARRMKGSR